jgi:hypothetical protein
MVALTSCRSQRSEVCSEAMQEQRHTFSENIYEQIDTSTFAINAEIDSPEVVIIRNDSITVKLRAKRVKITSKRKNAVNTSTVEKTAAAEQSQSNHTSTIRQTKDTSTPWQWLTWIVGAAIALLIFKLIKRKISCN